jgi:type 1 glutamine amidotransferase
MKRALVVWGGWPGHEPQACAGIVERMLTEDGFSVTVSDSTEAFSDLALQEMSLIVPIVTQSTIAREPLDNLCAAVESGVGLAGFHGGMADSFRNEVKYQFMVGGQWVAHPGNIIDYTVNITRPDDPVMQGIGDFPYRSEQYYMHTDPNNEVLATTQFGAAHCDWIGGHMVPVVWKRQHGKGRVFYSSLGHVAAEFAVPQMQTILRRGMAWAATR